MTIKIRSYVSDDESHVSDIKSENYGYAAKLLKANATIANLQKELSICEKQIENRDREIENIKQQKSFTDGCIATYKEIINMILEKHISF